LINQTNEFPPEPEDLNVEKTGSWKSEMPELVRDLLTDGIEKKATDIHIDPVGIRACRVCYRVDGVIHPQEELSIEKGRHLVNQIKVAAQFTPDRTFMPLEGKISLVEGQKTREVRVTILPTTRREAVHLRFLAAPDEVLEPSELGLREEKIEGIQTVFQRPEGLILFSGPTGGGKTMTLYSLVSFLDLQSLIAVSVEDPVEYDLPYVRQVQSSTETGLSMKDALKTFLRMDPDIIMIGEIRDSESAVGAVRAASSGRFVLATIHAGNPLLAVQACLQLSMPKHLLNSTLRMIVSQALVRQVCSACAGKRSPTGEEAEMFASLQVEVPGSVPVPKGCEKCHGYGYRGRTGVFEVLDLSQTPHPESPSDRPEDLFERLDAARESASGLQKDALTKVAAGITTMEEIKDIHVPGEPLMVS
jgi:type II secretory ATPase GspE/PulE/Tfp pilus assembly ATPase PilB-like protein